MHQSPVLLDLCSRKSRTARRSHDECAHIVFKFLRFEERFRKAPFSDGCSVNKAAFSNFSDVMWKGPTKTIERAVIAAFTS